MDPINDYDDDGNSVDDDENEDEKGQTHHLDLTVVLLKVDSIDDYNDDYNDDCDSVDASNWQ